jgi:hypothetical protein
VASKQLLHRYLWLAMVAFVILAATAYVRHSLIEPVSMGVFCESSASWECTVRRLSIVALQQGRLAWVALSFVIVAFATRVFPVALLAWAIACTGLVLYTAELCSFALLLAGLVSTLDRSVKTKPGNATQSQ